MARHLFLALILILGVWALWPREEAGAGDKDAQQASRSTRKYKIRVAPGIYMPGRRPMDVGKPLEALDKVAKEFEKLFPDTDIEFTEAPVGSREYLVTQLAAEQAPDILNVNVEDVWQDIQKGWYVALDPYLNAPNPFAEKGQPGSEKWLDQLTYKAISLGTIAPDGKMYCVPYDMVETGIFYNKDIFKRLGLEVPKDWPEFLAIQEKLQKAKYIPILVGPSEIADWAMDLTFDQLYNEILAGIDLYKDPIREQYLEGYLDWDEISFLRTKGFFTKKDPRFLATFRELKKWRQFFQKNMSADLAKLFVTQKAGMWWTASISMQKLINDPDVNFDWGVFYLPAMPKFYHKFADGHAQVVIGGSGTQFEVTNSAFNDTRDQKTSVKLKRTIAFLQYLFTPKNADMVVNEIMAFLPNVKGANPKPELMPFHEFLKRKYTTTKWLYTFDLRFNEIYRRMLDLYLNDGIREDEFIGWMESNVKTACETVVRRKKLDLAPLEAAWNKLEPVRKRMVGLPEEVRGD